MPVCGGDTSSTTKRNLSQIAPKTSQTRKQHKRIQRSSTSIFLKADIRLMDHFADNDNNDLLQMQDDLSFSSFSSWMGRANEQSFGSHPSERPFAFGEGPLGRSGDAATGDHNIEDLEPTPIGPFVSVADSQICLLYTSPSPRDQRGSRMPSSA